MEGDGVYRFGLDRRSVLGCDCKSETPSTVKRENGTVFLFVLTITVFLTFVEFPQVQVPFNRQPSV